MYSTVATNTCGLGRVTTGGLFKLFPVPHGDGITIGADGNLWFPEKRGRFFGKFNPLTEQFTEISDTYHNPGAHTEGERRHSENHPKWRGYYRPPCFVCQTNPSWIAAVPDGRIWAPQDGIWAFTTSGGLTTYQWPPDPEVSIGSTDGRAFAFRLAAGSEVKMYDKKEKKPNK